MTVREIARELNVPKSTVGDTCREGKVSEKVKGYQFGRPKLSNECDDRYLVWVSLQSRHLTAPVRKDVWRRELSITTIVKRHLQAAGLNG